MATTRGGMVWVALALAVSAAGSRARAAEPPDLETEAGALARLEQMARFVAEAERFRFVLDASYDVVQPDGRYLEFGETRRVAVRRPDRLRVDTLRRDGARRGLLYDGREIRAFDLDENVYAALPREGPVGPAIDYLVDDLGMRVPLGELISGELGVELASARGALFVGETRIGDVPCDHLAVRGVSVDLQVWVQQGDEPLPRRVVISYKDTPGRPQFRADLSDWELAADLPDSLFAFSPSDGTERIPFVAPARPGEASAGRP